jgi:hypothetical protein
VLLQQRDAGAPIDANASPGVPRLEAGEAADCGEELEDLLRQVVEAVREVLVLAGAVDVGAAVGPDAAPEERPRSCEDKIFLPPLEAYRSLVLQAGACCGKRQARWAL